MDDERVLALGKRPNYALGMFNRDRETLRRLNKAADRIFYLIYEADGDVHIFVDSDGTNTYFWEYDKSGKLLWEGPFTPYPEEAHPLPSNKIAYRRIANNPRRNVHVVTGRDAAFSKAAYAQLPMTMHCGYGKQTVFLDGSVYTIPVLEGWQPILDKAKEYVLEVADKWGLQLFLKSRDAEREDGIFLETKASGFTFNITGATKKLGEASRAAYNLQFLLDRIDLGRFTLETEGALLKLHLFDNNGSWEVGAPVGLEDIEKDTPVLENSKPGDVVIGVGDDKKDIPMADAVHERNGLFIAINNPKQPDFGRDGSPASLRDRGDIVFNSPFEFAIVLDAVGARLARLDRMQMHKSHEGIHRNILTGLQ